MDAKSAVRLSRVVVVVAGQGQRVVMDKMRIEARGLLRTSGRRISEDDDVRVGVSFVLSFGFSDAILTTSLVRDGGGKNGGGDDGGGGG